MGAGKNIHSLLGFSLLESWYWIEIPFRKIFFHFGRFFGLCFFFYFLLTSFSFIWSSLWYFFLFWHFFSSFSLYYLLFIWFLMDNNSILYKSNAIFRFITLWGNRFSFKSKRFFPPNFYVFGLDLEHAYLFFLYFYKKIT